MSSARWVIVDIETDGLYDPIHIVELAAQLMDGWEPVGNPFRMLVNHNVPIPAEAVAIHGYTQEYLARHGANPRDVYASFKDYARDYPIVAHNLCYDWNRCLLPEWSRLGISQIGQRGFCCMMLARRVVWESRSYRLDVLKSCFGLTQNQSHRGSNDVFTVVELFQKVYQPRLQSIGLSPFDLVSSFAKRTPVVKCINLVQESILPTSSLHKPQSSELTGDFSARAQKGLTPEPKLSKTMSNLVDVCRGIMTDGVVTTQEIVCLSSWLQDAGFITEWPASEIAHSVERILEDGFVTDKEKTELAELIRSVTPD